MSSYDHKIGTTAAGMTLLEALSTPVMAPKDTYTPSLNPVELASGAVRNLGFGLITWHWGYLEDGMVTMLRTFCTGKSATVYISSPDESKTFKTWRVKMIWPAGFDPTTTIYQDFTLEFRNPILIS